jgi:adenylate cyclase
VSDRPEAITGELFSIEKLLGLGEPRYTAIEVSRKAGLDIDQTRHLWRAMGFVLIPDDVVYFTDADLETLVTLAGFLEAGFSDIDLVIGITRVMSQNVARITDAQVDAIRHRLAASPELLARIATQSEAQVSEEIFQPLERFLAYVWRRHMANSLQRTQVLQPEGFTSVLAVGFADIVGFTRLSRELNEEELARTIDAFEAAANNAATETGARVVKTIGDEVMFVADDARQAAEMALHLAEEFSQDDGTLQVRIGVAIGDVITHFGDYYGPTVNLANRSVGEARPGTILVSEELAEALHAESGYEVKPIPRKKLKGIGHAQLYVLRRAVEDP